MNNQIEFVIFQDFIWKCWKAAQPKAGSSSGTDILVSACRLNAIKLQSLQVTQIIAPSPKGRVQNLLESK